MRHIIIGTAGHIDHGKTTLIRALTGRNTDRWEEEQKRGITIDLGFTYFDLPSGDRAGIIDVPGHEKFINNMVAGVVGMDLVLLVVSAEEGIMPQTREHLDILGLLGMKKSILVLNKCDLVEEDWLELVEDEIKEEVKGTFIEGAPICHVSAATGQGIDQLIQTIEQVLKEGEEEKDVDTIPRLPIDRAFSLSGFGTIITGTLLSGTINKDTTLMMYPIGKECKIRSIQVHGQDQKTCYAGQRVAINLSNVKKTELHRGCVLAPPESMKNTMMLDVKMNVLPSSMRILTNHSRLHLYTGTSEILCRAILLDKEEIAPGESGFVQLRLEEELAVRRGDKFVVRFYSPMETIGGGVILEPNPSKKKRFDEQAIKELEQKESGSSADVVELHIRQHKGTMVTAKELAVLSAVSLEETQKDLEELKERGDIYLFPLKKETYAWHVLDEKKSRELILHTLSDYHKAHPYRFGMRKAEVHMSYFKEMKPAVFDAYLEWLEHHGQVTRYMEYIKEPEFTIPHDATYEKVSQKITQSLTKAGYDFLRLEDIDFSGEKQETIDDILNGMMGEGKIIRVGEELYTTKELLEEAKKQVVERLEKNGGIITIAEVRDMFNTSRKSAKPILEYMDTIKVTKKTGGESERVAY